MTTATAHSLTPLDPYAAWMAENGAAYCHRMTATITLKQCEYQQSKNSNDCRCRGCVGLFNQDEIKQVRRSLALIRSVDKMIETAEANAPKPVKSDKQMDGMAALDEIIEDLYANPLDSDDFEDVELDLDDEQLLALFPELANTEEEDNEINYPRFTEYQTAMPQYAVYRGRCKKCGGYVQNTRERQDDKVFHCLECGWRTGPEYESNRALNAAGGIIL